MTVRMMRMGMIMMRMGVIMMMVMMRMRVIMMMVMMMVMMRNWKRLSLILYNNCAFIAHYMVWLREIPLL